MLKQLLWILSKLFSGANVLERDPDLSHIVTLDELVGIIKGKLPNAQVNYSDNTYALCTYDDIAWMLLNDQTDKMEYESEELDCDDFSYRLLGQFSVPKWSHLAFGIIWSDTHAFNFFVTEDKKVLFVEPQTDAITEDFKGRVRFMVL